MEEKITPRQPLNSTGKGANSQVCAKYLWINKCFSFNILCRHKRLEKHRIAVDEMAVTASPRELHGIVGTAL